MGLRLLSRSSIWSTQHVATTNRVPPDSIERILFLEPSTHVGAIGLEYLAVHIPYLQTPMSH
jgi:hypothetical protein